MPHHEIETLTELADLLGTGAPLHGHRLQGLDLRGSVGTELVGRDVSGLVVLGGHLTPVLEHRLRKGGATIFPGDPHAPIDPYRAHAYTAAELYDTLEDSGYADSVDARAYRWLQGNRDSPDVFDTLLQSIHDHSMTDSLDELVEGRDVVGIMGGHAVPRGSDDYGDAARLGHRLADAGLLVATGGGPGAMEAANLGALCRHEATLATALTTLSSVPSFRPSIDAWAKVAWTVREGVLAAGGRRPAAEHDVRSIGVPTWFYGHEPPNLFASAIVKYFSNALREDVLLGRCTAGVVVLPGAAGTVQEIFQAATRLFYGDDATDLPRMVLVGRRHWEEEVPVWPLLRSLGEGRRMGEVVHLVDDIDDVLPVLLHGDPIQGRE
ncbi:LOG family protein [Janibacter sp. G1551]|uniref:LOG family protein n=1 Tax=Janibacter sp. G1551 TaxID=3420440 RepID=UPI003D022617